MRNWNKSPVQKSPWLQSPILSYLWGIETLAMLQLSICYSMILSYLWGIETRFDSENKVAEVLDFILPMRNWNISLAMKLAVSVLRFYLTYEELKPKNNFRKSEIYQRFYLTYEELKHRVAYYLDMGLGDFILPMRNWNLKMVVDLMLKMIEILSYLWGIETI